mgnify:CR=1 FL=1
MIVSCRNLVLVLSDGLLASADHVREAEAALAAGVNLLPVLPEGCRWPDAQGNRVSSCAGGALDVLAPHRAPAVAFLHNASRGLQ